MSLPIVSAREGYDLWGPGYDAYDNALIALEEPVVMRMLGSVAGLQVLDVGCGTGRHALRMAGEGARVTGVDFSIGMMDALRAKQPPESLSLIEHDITRGLPVESERFDLVLCSLVLEHVHDLRGMLGEFRRVLRRGGRAVIADLHPEMIRRGIHARFRVEEGGEKLQIAAADHKISDYVMASVGAGLVIADIAEYEMDAETAARSPSAAKYVGDPLLFVLALQRPH